MDERANRLRREIYVVSAKIVKGCDHRKLKTVDWSIGHNRSNLCHVKKRSNSCRRMKEQNEQRKDNVEDAKENYISPLLLIVCIIVRIGDFTRHVRAGSFARKPYRSKLCSIDPDTSSQSPVLPNKLQIVEGIRFERLPRTVQCLAYGVSSNVRSDPLPNSLVRLPTLQHFSRLHLQTKRKKETLLVDDAFSAFLFFLFQKAKVAATL